MRENAATTARIFRNHVIQLLKDIPWQSLGVKAVVVYGSILRGNKKPRDIDLLIVPAKSLSLDEETRIAEIVEKVCGLEADIAVINPDNPNCELLLIALDEGELVYIDDREGLLTKTIMLCYDFKLSKEKLRYTETLVEAVLKSVTREAYRDNS